MSYWKRLDDSDHDDDVAPLSNTSELKRMGTDHDDRKIKGAEIHFACDVLESHWCP